ncbi:MAG: type III-B CRISPR module RAMP protein Cmr4 [Methylococcaceae bacterium]
MENSIYHLHTITALHVGTGQGIGVIDMPIARERASNLPQVPGSGIKGVLRDECFQNVPSNDASDTEKALYQDYLALFGPEAGEKASEFAGAISVGDARLLCLPIRSWKGTFAWVTCPMILERYKRDLIDNDDLPGIKQNFDNNTHAKHTSESALVDVDTEMIYLEDLDLKSAKDADEWAEFISQKIFDDDEWKILFKQRFLIINNDIFDFLSETATEIRARIKIKQDTRTVQEGGLWYEEYLPAETLLWGILASDNSRNPAHNKQANELLAVLPTIERLQIGGNATVGAGQVRWIKGE